LKNIATVIRAADIMACQAKIGFYFTARHDEVGPELLDALGITPAQFEEVRASVPQQLEEAETTLKS
jgi:hypothetical protein